ncbi:hypothetical protein [Pseudobacter ginsenosidimutans]|uniref:Uncharacterized protein n=1 Tax=Pseudobacter ginsenosidimutans TaxID=661488 RepID=A0A4Q7MT42_9BACT|nr:hypothetical protein [Pseudobacter ginsenosidimutans]QEC42091.1 hypothetical protein FSB84_10480 [Pseudobacter ginsenosidimutans]RZS71069.1 hypothetical protein EV199_2970 [Pseudobacter ginsenosidimutans]
MKKHTTQITGLWIAILLLAACNKGENNFFYKEELFPVAFKGYNGSNERLIIKLDTFTSPLMLSANTSFNSSTSFSFYGNQKTVKLSVTEENTGKSVLEKELKKEDGQAIFSFFYLDGRIGDMPEKAAIEAEKIRIIYMFIPSVTQYSEPVDIVFGKYYVTPQVFEEKARLNNLKPYEFSEPATIPTFSVARQEYNGVMTSALFSVRIYKTGTNIPYIDGTEYTWNALNSTAPKPASSNASSKLYIFSEQPVGNAMRFFTRFEQ